MKKIIIILLTISLCLLTGCNNKYNDGFSEGYSTGYDAGYDSGYTDGYNLAVSEYKNQVDSYEEKIDSYEEQISDYEAQTVKEEPQTYILNKNSKKFHKPTCSSVSKMKESNKVERICTRSELIEDGYSPCQSCKP